MLTGGTYLQGSRLALVHIPVRLYPYFLQPILRVLFGTDDSIPIESSQARSDFEEPKTWMNRHLFLNVSLTPVECSVFCSRALADEIFKPLAEDFNAIAEGWEERVRDSLSPGEAHNEKITIYPDDYVAIEVNGQGDAGQRVLELTAPLAMAGMYVEQIGGNLCRANNEPLQDQSFLRPLTIATIFLCPVEISSRSTMCLNKMVSHFLPTPRHSRQRDFRNLFQPLTVVLPQQLTVFGLPLSARPHLLAHHQLLLCPSYK